MATRLEDLKAFIVELIQEFDPTIDTSNGSPVDMGVIEPILTRLSPDPIETDTYEFLRTKLAQEHPDKAVGDEDQLTDMLIKPLTLFLEPFKREMQHMRHKQSLAYSDLMSVEEVGEITDNLFIARDKGRKVNGTVRVYYDNPIPDTVTPSVRFFTPTGTSFYPGTYQAITAQQMILQSEDDLYYWDVFIVAAEAGTDYDIDEGLLTGVEGIPDAVKVSNKNSFSGGFPADTKESLISKASTSSAERSLTTARGIRSRIYDLFGDVSAVQPIGYQDVEMNRDILVGSDRGIAYASGMGILIGHYALVFVTWYYDVVGTDSSLDVGDILDVYYPELLVDLQPSLSRNEQFEVMHKWFDLGEIIYGDEASPLDLLFVELDKESDDATSSLGFVPISFVWRKGTSSINLSDIPGGITKPNTDWGTLQILSNELHIGGHTDVFIRPKSVQDKSLVLTDIPSKTPVAFGEDLTVLANVALAPLNRVTTGEDLTVNGVKVGMFLHIENGVNEGLYRILKVDSNLETIDPPTEFYMFLDVNFSDAEPPLRFRVYDDVILDSIEITRTIYPMSGAFTLNLTASAGYPNVEVNADLVGYGAAVGDILEIQDGPDKGVYTITAFDAVNGGYEPTLSRTMTSSGSGRFFKVYRVYSGIERPLVRFKDVDILDSSEQKTGVTVPYGMPVDIRNTCCLHSAEDICCGNYGVFLPDFYELVNEQVPETLLDVESMRAEREFGHMFAAAYNALDRAYDSVPEGALEKFGQVIQFYDPECDGFVFPVLVPDIMGDEGTTLRFVEFCIPRSLFDGDHNMFLAFPDFPWGSFARFIESTYRFSLDDTSGSVANYRAPAYAYPFPDIPDNCVAQGRKGDILVVKNGKEAGSYIIEDTFLYDFDLGTAVENWVDHIGPMPAWWPHLTGQPWPPVWFWPKGPGSTAIYPPSEPYWWSYNETARVWDGIAATANFGLPEKAPYWWNNMGRLFLGDLGYLAWPQTVAFTPNPYWWPVLSPDLAHFIAFPGLWPVLDMKPPSWLPETGLPTEVNIFNFDEYSDLWEGMDLTQGLGALLDTLFGSWLPMITPHRPLGEFYSKEGGPDWPPKFEVPSTAPPWYPTSGEWAGLTSMYPSGTPPLWWDEDLDGEWTGWEEIYGVYLSFEDFLSENVFPKWSASRSIKFPIGIAKTKCLFPGVPKWHCFTDYLQESTEVYNEIVDLLIAILPDPYKSIVRIYGKSIINNFSALLEKVGSMPAMLGLIANAFASVASYDRGVFPYVATLLYNLWAMFTIKDWDIGGTVYWGEDEDAITEEVIDVADLLERAFSGIFAEYCIERPAKGVLRTYFADPVTFEASSMCNEPTIFTTEEEGAEYLFITEPEHEYTIIPAQTEEGEPGILDLPRELELVNYLSGVLRFCDVTIPTPAMMELQVGRDKVDIHHERFFYGRMYAWMHTTAELIGDMDVYSHTITINPTFPTLSNESELGIRTLEGSNLVQLPKVEASQFSVGAIATLPSFLDLAQRPVALDFLKEFEGDILTISYGSDEGSYRIIRYVDPITVQLDRPLTYSTYAAAKAGAAYFFHAEEGVLWDYTDGSGAQKNEEGNYMFPIVDAYDPFVPFLEIGDVALWLSIFGSTDLDGLKGSFEIDEIVDWKFDGGNPWTRALAKVSPTVDFPHEAGKSGDKIQLNCAVAAFTMHVGSGDTTDEPYGVQMCRVYNDEPHRYTLVDFTTDLDPAVATFTVMSDDLEVGSRVWPGVKQPFRVVRTELQKITSTQMAEQFDGTLYYFDVDVIGLQGNAVTNFESGHRFEAVLGTYQCDGYRLVTDDNNYTFSMLEETDIHFPKSLLPVGAEDYPTNKIPLMGSNIQIKYDRSPTVETVSAVVQSESERVLLENMLVRHFLPSYTIVNFNYKGGSASSVIAPEILELVNSKGALDALTVSDIHGKLHGFGATYVEQGAELISLTHDIDRRIVGSRGKDQIGGVDGECYYDGTNRVSYFISGPDKSKETVPSDGEGVRITRLSPGRVLR